MTNHLSPITRLWVLEPVTVCVLPSTLPSSDEHSKIARTSPTSWSGPLMLKESSITCRCVEREEISYKPSQLSSTITCQVSWRSKKPTTYTFNGQVNSSHTTLEQRCKQRQNVAFSTQSRKDVRTTLLRHRFWTSFQGPYNVHTRFIQRCSNAVCWLGSWDSSV